MPAQKAPAIQLSPEQEAALNDLVRAHSTRQKLAERARIILLAAAGKGMEETAAALGVWRKTVHQWGASGSLGWPGWSRGKEGVLAAEAPVAPGILMHSWVPDHRRLAPAERYTALSAFERCVEWVAAEALRPVPPDAPRIARRSAAR